MPASAVPRQRQAARRRPPASRSRPPPPQRAHPSRGNALVDRSTSPTRRARSGRAGSASRTCARSGSVGSAGHDPAVASGGRGRAGGAVNRQPRRSGVDPCPAKPRRAGFLPLSAPRAAVAPPLHVATLLHVRPAPVHGAPAPAGIAALVEKEPAAVRAAAQPLEAAVREQVDDRVRKRPERGLEVIGVAPLPPPFGAVARRREFARASASDSSAAPRPGRLDSVSRPPPRTGSHDRRARAARVHGKGGLGRLGVPPGASRKRLCGLLVERTGDLRPRQQGVVGAQRFGGRIRIHEAAHGVDEVECRWPPTRSRFVSIFTLVSIKRDSVVTSSGYHLST